MTWLNFKNKILPNAIKIEAHLDDITKLMALTTINNINNINSSSLNNTNFLKWNNPFSWYYHNGVNLEIRNRIQNSNGKTDYTKIRCSMIYDTLDEVDLHCITPNDNHLFYCKKNVDNGVLDVDIKPDNNIKAISNIYFDKNCDEGIYLFYIKSYKQKSLSQIVVTIELEIDNKIYISKETLTYENQEKTIFKFDYSKNKGIQFLSEVTNATPILTSEDFKNIWNLDNLHDSNNLYNFNSKANTNNFNFININAIVDSPNMWLQDNQQEPLNPLLLNQTTQYSQLKNTTYFEDYKKYFGNSMQYKTNYISYEYINNISGISDYFKEHHVFFILDKCLDLSNIKGKSLPVEHINNLNQQLDIAELIELSNNYYISNSSSNNNNYACGLGYIKENIWNLLLKVTDKNNIIKFIRLSKFF